MEPDLTVAVVGLGKIGLPLAAQYASKGATVIGCDEDEGVVGVINAGRCPLENEEGLAEALEAARSAGRLRATTDTAWAVSKSQVVVVIVPVGVDTENRTDYRNLDAAAISIGGGLRAGTLVIVETTVPVGATRNRFGRDLALASGLRQDEFRLAYSPERVYSGRILHDLKTYPKVTGGVDEASGQAAADFYRRVLDAEVLPLPDAETAEFAKLAESVYRDLNIALANELAVAAEELGVDYAVAAGAANTQPYSHLHAPGLGVGGHCIPVYPYFLMEGADQPLVRLGRQTNDAMAAYGVERLDAAMREAGETGLEGATVLVLGLSYRGGVKEAAHSSAFGVVEALERRGARPLVHDPLFSDEEIQAFGLEPGSWPPAGPVDAVVLQAAHGCYSEADLSKAAGCRWALDGRGAWERSKVEAAGVRDLAIGVGERSAEDGRGVARSG